MGRRHRKRRTSEEVELNLAAMLDMAFQLLTFFILTFKPSPVEGELQLRMPPPQVVKSDRAGGEKAGADESNKNLVAGLDTLVITVAAGRSGGIAQMELFGSTQTDNRVALGKDMSRLNEELKRLLGAKNTPFEQVIVQASSDLRYDALMQVVEVCSAQTIRTPEGDKRLTKLTFVPLDAPR